MNNEKLSGYLQDRGSELAQEQNAGAQKDLIADRYHALAEDPFKNLRNRFTSIEQVKDAKRVALVAGDVPSTIVWGIQNINEATGMVTIYGGEQYGTRVEHFSNLADLYRVIGEVTEDPDVQAMGSAQEDDVEQWDLVRQVDAFNSANDSKRSSNL